MDDISGGVRQAGGGSLHPLRACAAQLSGVLDEVAAADPAYCSTRDKHALLVELTRVADRVGALRMQVLAESDDVALEHGARSVGVLVAHEVRDHPSALVRATRLGEALVGRYAVLGAAVREGRVRVAQAEVIVRALDKVGDAVSRELRAKAEAHLVALAAQWGPRELRRLGDQVWAVLAPEDHEDSERQLVEAELRRAEAATRLSIRDRADGTADVHARLPQAAATRLRTYLEAFTSPRRESAAAARVPIGMRSLAATDPATGRRVPHEEVLGRAFCAFLETVDPGWLPVHGGAATTVTVTMTLDDLTRGTGVGVLHDGRTLPPGEVRRLACTAGVVPAVLGGGCEVLDLGRSRRLFSPAQRKALALRHSTCACEGCTIPARWCEAHHAGRAWSRGGRTDLAEATLFCSRHHHLAHDPAYDARRLPDGGYRFHRRT